jgi:hypothetical protein
LFPVTTLSINIKGGKNSKNWPKYVNLPRHQFWQKKITKTQNKKNCQHENESLGFGGETRRKKPHTRLKDSSLFQLPKVHYFLLAYLPLIQKWRWVRYNNKDKDNNEWMLGKKPLPSHNFDDEHEKQQNAKHDENDDHNRV